MGRFSIWDLRKCFYSFERAYESRDYTDSYHRHMSFRDRLEQYILSNSREPDYYRELLKTNGDIITDFWNYNKNNPSLDNIQNKLINLFVASRITKKNEKLDEDLSFLSIESLLIS